MNRIVEEIASWLGSKDWSQEEFLAHHGTPQNYDFDPNGSGRYRQGSGENPLQHPKDILDRIEKLKMKGWTETPENIWNEFKLTTKQYRQQKSIAVDNRKYADFERIKGMQADGLSNTEIAKRLGVNESVIRSRLKQEENGRYRQSRETADFLKERLKTYPMIDVGKGTETELGITENKKDTALELLRAEGYQIRKCNVEQPTNKGQYTITKVLMKPDAPYKDVYNFDEIHSIKDYYSPDLGETYEKKFNYPVAIDNKRVKILLKDEIGPDGLPGVAQDGIIQLRRGVQDLDLGDSKYAQVRIMVDIEDLPESDRKYGYLKGMAVYSDNMPDGIDVVFNSNKKTVLDGYKKIKDDPENPFGSAIKPINEGGQYFYIDKKTGEKKLGAINKRADQGDWTDWNDALPSQFLGKQNEDLIIRQLNKTKLDTNEEFNSYMELTNPIVKKYFLEKFAMSCDKRAVDLKAAAIPGQKYHAIIPCNTLKDDEIFAPQYENGTKLALIRYPHGGTFEIPILTVNNKNKQGLKVIGNDSIDAVGITAAVAERLSGADFDGDTVMCIPTHVNGIKIKSTDRLKGLIGFDTKQYQYDKKVPANESKDGEDHYYRNGKEFSIMKNTQTEMGIISNMISDMNLAGAPEEHLERAVRHSMVVIDAEKHGLDYKQSYEDNGIAELKKLYQLKFDNEGNARAGGASTILSRAKGKVAIPITQGQPYINLKGKNNYDPSRPEGALIYKEAEPKKLYYPEDHYDKKTGQAWIKLADKKEKIYYNKYDPKEYEYYKPELTKDKKTGEYYYTNKGDHTLKYSTKKRTKYSTQMYETDDAYTLVSINANSKEKLYAEFANYMKNIANTARKAYAYIEEPKKDPNASKVYAKEVNSLLAKLNEAKSNSPKERLAERLTTAYIKKYKKEHPDMTAEDERKMAQRKVTEYRQSVGAKTRTERNIDITPEEWKAIQANAITKTKLIQILNNTDTEVLRKYSMPKKDNKEVTQAQISRIKNLSANGNTLNSIAIKMNMSTSQIADILKGDY